MQHSNLPSHVDEEYTCHASQDLSRTHGSQETITGGKQQFTKHTKEFANEDLEEK